jgi:uncharacterized membrane protein
VPRWAGWIAFGALLEIAILYSAVPQRSEDPLTPWQRIAGYLLMPAGTVAGAFAATLGHAIDRLPKSIATSIVLLTFVIGFLLEAAILAVPFWALTRVTLRRRRSI